MEHYDKEKHFGLIKEHMKKASLENRELDIYSRFDNNGNVLYELYLNETTSVKIKGKDLQEICNEVYSGMEYHQAMIDYIAQKENSLFTDIQWHQGTSIDPMTSSRMVRSLERYKSNVKNLLIKDFID